MVDTLFNDGGVTTTTPTTLPYTGFYVPIADLPGMDSTELATTVPDNEKEGKVVYSVVQALFNYLSVNTNRLGLSISKTNPQVVSSVLISQTYSTVVDYTVDVSAGDVTMIPVPTAGAFTGVGDFSLNDVFPTSFVVSDTDNTADASGIDAAGPGVLISSVSLDPYGFFNDVPGSDITTFNITGDCRYAMSSYFQAVCDGNVAVRSSSTASGITAVAVSNATVVTIPAAFTATTNPTSGISSADLDHISLSRRTYSITFELSIVAQNLEINPVTQ